MRALLVFALASAACHSDAGGVCKSGAAGAFTKQTLDTAYRGEGVAVFDVNRDGVLDLVTDQFWYAGPSFAPHEIRTPETFDPMVTVAKELAVYPQDVDGDGWTDIIVAPHPTDVMYWYRNPGRDEHWTPYVITPAGVAGLETPMVVDLFGDGRPVLLMSDSVQGLLGWYTPPADPTQPWLLHPISGIGYPATGPFEHGIGAGDVDGDGRLDVLTSYGWFQQTADPARWIEHDVSFGTKHCSRMYAYDIDADGKADVLCSSPHDYGLYWFRQVSGEFEPHLIDDSISELHTMGLDDLDGDGVPEIIVGKRWLAHVAPYFDPGAHDPALLVYYSIGRCPIGPTFERHTIDDDSGLGTQFVVTDVDGDGKVDVVAANKKGLFLFRQR
jgi:hypothetical protein